MQPEEDILLSIRRKPKAVRLEWTGGSSKGREVIFSPALDAKVIYVHQPATAVVMPSMKIAVDSPLVMKNSRHTIADAGFDTILANLQKSRQAADAGKTGRPDLEYKGLEKTAGLDRPCHHFVRHTAAGETWNIYLDPRSLLPRLVLAENAQGEMLERYVYSDIRENPTDLASAGGLRSRRTLGRRQGPLFADRQGRRRVQCAKQQRIDDALTAKLTHDRAQCGRETSIREPESPKNVTIDLEMVALFE